MKYLFLLLSIVVTLMFVYTVEAQPSVKGYKQTNINDLVLIYQGGVHRIDWTSDQFLPYVVHQDLNGKKDWLFDGFLFLEFKDGKGRCYVSRYEKEGARKQEWSWLLDRLFESEKALPALNECIASQAEQLGKPNFRHKVVIGIPDPIPGQKDWGTLNGRVLDFANEIDKYDACQWYIDELIKRFKAAGLDYLDLAGFYWVSEDIVTSKALTVPIGDYIRAKDYKFYWIPYWNAMGYSDWKALGFDVAYSQPNHFFEASITDDRIDKTCRLAYTHNLGLEIEFDERALSDHKSSFYTRLETYLDRFEKNNVFKESAIAYYEGGGAILSFSKSENPKDQRLMDRLASLIQSRRLPKQQIGSYPAFGLDSTIWKIDKENTTTITTKGQIEKKYGRIELELKMPETKAKVFVRLRPVESSKTYPDEEITLLSYHSSDPERIHGGIFTEALNWNTGNKKGTSIEVKALTNTYHTFTCDWSASSVQLFVDGVPFFAFDNDFGTDVTYWPFDKAYYLEIEMITPENSQHSILDVKSVSF